MRTIEKEKVEFLIQQLEKEEDRKYLKEVFDNLFMAFETSNPKQGVIEKRKQKRLIVQALDSICRLGVEIGKHEVISEILKFLKHFD